MKKRDKIFLVTATLLFLLSWCFLSTLIDAGQAVGDAPTNFNSTWYAFYISSLLIAFYGLIYYGIYMLTLLFKRMKKKPLHQK